MTDQLDLVDQPVEGLIPSGHDDRDWPLMAAVPDEIPLPDKFRSGVWPTVNQGHTPSCVGQSSAVGRTISEKLTEGIDVRFDGYELYAACKKLDGRPNMQGTSQRLALQIMKSRGAKVKDRDEYMPIEAYVRVGINLRELKTAILTFGSVLTGSRWFSEWNNGGLLPGAVMGEPKNGSVGHAYLLIGWDDSIQTPFGKGAFLLHNSFGSGWGKGGTAWLPYELALTKLWDAWQTIDLIESAKPEPEPEPTPEPAPEPVPVTPEDDMPSISQYAPGVVASISSGGRVRPAPSVGAKAIRTISSPESWVIVGFVAGDKALNSDQWAARWAGDHWEYTHASNVASKQEPEAQLAELRQELAEAKSTAESAEKNAGAAEAKVVAAVAVADQLAAAADQLRSLKG